MAADSLLLRRWSASAPAAGQRRQVLPRATGVANYPMGGACKVQQ